MKRRAWLLALIVGLLGTLSSLAYASPPDPAWISGFFDDGDHDDVVVLVTSAGGAIDPFPLHGEWTVPAPANRLSPGQSPSIPTRRSPSCSTPRAPPAA